MRHSLIFWHSLFLLSLVLFISLVTLWRRRKWSPIEGGHEEWAASPKEFPYFLNSTLKGATINLSWNFDLAEESIEFRVLFSPPTIAAVLIGFSDHGQLEGSDFCLFRVDSRQMEDGWLDRRWTLHKDVHQDCELTMAKKGAREFRFRRRFATCDPRDYRIEKGTGNILMAATARNQFKSLKDAGMAHEMRYTQLLPAESEAKDGTTAGGDPDSKTMDIRPAGVRIPPQITTYWCAIVELGEELKRRKHHAIKYEAVITPGNEQFVHHFEVFHCQRPTRPFVGDCSRDKPAEAKSCSKVLAAWSMGANPVVYPPEAGMPLGGPGFVPFLMVEIHYNNPRLIAGQKDSSGLRITYTPRLRRFDAGIMELGLIYSDANSIPPRQPAWPITAYCPMECTEKFPAGGIRIFASQLHAHLTGRRLFTSHIRGGRKIGEVNRDDHYSPHWQHIQRLHPPHVHVLPGDVLATSCVYETRGLDRWTWGGYGIEEEMCVNYIHYYPASEVEVCKSAISNSSLQAFFSKLGVKDKRLGIHEKYSAIEWSEAKLALLRELYHVSPLNVACLQHSGLPFPGHPNNWTRVPRPEYASAPLAGERAAQNGDECLAIND